MSRVHRLLTTDRIFFVTVNLRRAHAPLAADEFRLVAAAINESRSRVRFLLCGYVLMPDHWHALIWTGHPLTISRVVQNITWISARSLNGARRASGPVWQHQFWDRFVRHEKELAARFDYVHLNPVRKGLVSKPEQWRWSSYNNFALEQRTGETLPASDRLRATAGGISRVKNPRHKPGAVATGYIPARRATKVDPMVALRYE